MCTSNILHLAKILDKGSLRRLKNSADAAQSLEDRWMWKLRIFYRRLDEQVWNHILEYGEPPKHVDFQDFYAEHAIEAIALGYRTAESREQDISLPYGLGARLAAPPPDGKLPKGFKDLMELWDKWRRKKKVPKRQKEISKRIERAYLDKVQSVWEKYSEQFRVGTVETQASVRAHIVEATETTFARAKTIVQTETTRYYNAARRQIYDQSKDVTHYLFVAIRDSATTKWCNTRRGLVYTKDTKFLELETPPIHWNCRSEILPLSPLNPAHLVLINDLSRRRENNSPTKLPKEWNRTVA
jgi:SPP1 gp7 family putative phage head morphogenesis protein